LQSQSRAALLAWDHEDNPEKKKEEVVDEEDIGSDEECTSGVAEAVEGVPKLSKLNGF
jgi:hypothetical protein